MRQDVSIKETANIWYFTTSSCDKTIMNKVLSVLSKARIVSEKWSFFSKSKIGLVFFGGLHDYEEVISFLHIQIKEKGYRVCVLNLNADLFEADYKIKILKYGGEYFFERSYLSEPFDALVERLNRWLTIDRLLTSPVIKKRISGNSLSLIKMLRLVIEAGFYSTNNVLILGERGTGKEQVAHIIHDFDTRKDKGEFIVLDCTTLKKDLSGSELFGHEKGSYTGADYNRDGAVALAHKGTFFLDEIVELPLSLQAEFLRVVQEGTYKKVGSNIWRYSEFRLVSATNKDLRLLAEHDEFRKDLLDRIQTTVIKIPSLDERKEDIPGIIDFYFQKQYGENNPVIEKEVYEYLSQKTYPGNIRQLKNIISNIFLKYSGKGPVTLGDLPDTEVELSGLTSQSKWFERKELIDLLSQAIEEGYELKRIEEIVQSIATRITLYKVRKNKDASKLLGKSERWIQMQKFKEKNT